MKLTALIVVVALLLALCAAWGPSTHYYFTCTALRGSQDFATCMKSRATLLSGTDMPDAFFFGDFVDSGACVGLAELHDAAFATFMTIEAIKTGSQELIDFSLGYGAHIVGDFAGFFPGGFLGNGFFPNSSFVNWVSLWPYMTSVDSLVLQTKFAGAAIPTSVPIVSNHVARFFSNVSNYFHANIEASIPNATVEQVLACGAQWKSVVSIETVKAAKLPAASWQYEVLYNNPFNATSFIRAANDFQMAAGCAVGGISLWASAVQMANATVMGVIGSVEGYFESQFLSGKCSPTAMKRTGPPRRGLRMLRPAA